jgi:hypothetical protein
LKEEKTKQQAGTRRRRRYVTYFVYFSSLPSFFFFNLNIFRRYAMTNHFDDNHHMAVFVYRDELHGFRS